MGISSMLTNCDKDDTLANDEKLNHSTETLSRIQLKTGDNVSKEVVNYLKAKSGNSLKVTFSKGKVKLSDGGVNARETALGTIDTTKEIVIDNETNIAHTFNVTTISNTNNSITNLIVVETSTSIYEYFLVYTFEGVLPYDSESNTVLLSHFTGSIATYDDGGVLIGTMRLESGEVISIEGQNSVDCSEVEDASDSTDSTDTSSGSDSSGGIDTNTGDGTTTGDDTSTGGGAWIADSEGGCSISWAHLECNGQAADVHGPRYNSSLGENCSGSIVVLKDCYGNVIGASGRESSSTSKGGEVVDPCAGTVGVILDLCTSDTAVANLTSVLSLSPEQADCLSGTGNCNLTSELNQFMTDNPTEIAFGQLVADAICSGAEVDFEKEIIVNIEDSCQKKIVQSAIDIAHPLVQNIKDLFESDDKFKLNIISEDLPGSIESGIFRPAQTLPLADCNTDGDCIITIKLDSEMLSTSTDYFIKANVLHEMVHAALVYFYSTGELEVYGVFDPFTAMLFEAMAEFEAMQSGLVLSDGSNLNEIHHLYMTNMATDLKEALIGSDVGMDTLLPDEFYQDLTWGGSLKETTSFTEIYDTAEKVLRCAHTNTAEATANDSGPAYVQGVEAEFNPICDE